MRYWGTAVASVAVGLASAGGVVPGIADAASPSGRIASGELNVSSSTTEWAETELAVSPGNPNRLGVGANPGGVLFVSDDGGSTPLRPVAMPATVSVMPGPHDETPALGGDPMLAADALGNIWYGELAAASGSSPSRIVINRLAAGTDGFQPKTVGLPVRTPGLQDKNLMTIDNAPGSPTFGRLYVVWGEPQPAGQTKIVIVQCDTRPGGIANAANCDDPANWTVPASVTDTTGDFINADVAVAPNGKVYVTWWDFSATNAIRGAVCDPSAVNCAAGASWVGTNQTIATLDSSFGTPVPFACPTLAQPGGRVSPESQIAIDRSGGQNNGRVYVTFGDLRPGSGTVKCPGAGPMASEMTWDVFVVSASGALPVGAMRTPLYVNGEGGGAASSDQWFPWLAVDQTTGLAWASFYSTRDDATRRTANYYFRSVTPNGSGNTLGPLIRASGVASDYSGRPCCAFGNDYGDYEGIDATNGFVFPVWADKRNAAPGQVFMGAFNEVSSTPTPTPTPGAGTPTTSSSSTQAPPTPGATTPTRAPNLPSSDLDILSRRLGKRGRFTLNVEVFGAGTVIAEVSAALPAGLLRATGSRSRVRYGSAQADSSGPGTIQLTIKPSARARRALRTGRSLRLSIAVTFTNGVTPPTTKSTVFRVKSKK